LSTLVKTSSSIYTQHSTILSKVKNEHRTAVTLQSAVGKSVTLSLKGCHLPTCLIKHY